MFLSKNRVITDNLSEGYFSVLISWPENVATIDALEKLRSSLLENLRAPRLENSRQAQLKNLSVSRLFAGESRPEMAAISAIAHIMIYPTNGKFTICEDCESQFVIGLRCSTLMFYSNVLLRCFTVPLCNSVLLSYSAVLLSRIYSGVTLELLSSSVQLASSTSA